MRSDDKLGLGGWFGFAGWTVVATILSFLIHELGHYTAGVILGFDMWFNLNSAGNYNEIPPNEFQQTIITMAGPVVTVIQGFIAAALVRSRQSLWLFSFVAATFWQRTFAFATTMAISPNDEGRIALMYDLPLWAIHSVTSGLLLVILVWASMKARAGLLTQLVTWFAVTVGVTIVVLGTQAFPMKFG
ncbi:MAG: hypothetical protein HRU11_04305 [Parvularculaceae bacterium]|nr:hypothetical protein [Parvularculaceae bacterium]